MHTIQKIWIQKLIGPDIPSVHCETFLRASNDSNKFFQLTLNDAHRGKVFGGNRHICICRYICTMFIYAFNIFNV